MGPADVYIVVSIYIYIPSKCQLTVMSYIYYNFLLNNVTVVQHVLYYTYIVEWKIMILTLL